LLTAYFDLFVEKIYEFFFMVSTVHHLRAEVPIKVSLDY
jgi:hypothetical protein